MNENASAIRLYSTFLCGFFFLDTYLDKFNTLVHFEDPGS